MWDNGAPPVCGTGTFHEYDAEATCGTPPKRRTKSKGMPSLLGRFFDFDFECGASGCIPDEREDSWCEEDLPVLYSAHDLAAALERELRGQQQQPLVIPQPSHPSAMEVTGAFPAQPMGKMSLKMDEDRLDRGPTLENMEKLPGPPTRAAPPKKISGEELRQRADKLREEEQDRREKQDKIRDNETIEDLTVRARKFKQLERRRARGEDVPDDDEHGDRKSIEEEHEERASMDDEDRRSMEDEQEMRFGEDFDRKSIDRRSVSEEEEERQSIDDEDRRSIESEERIAKEERRRIRAEAKAAAEKVKAEKAKEKPMSKEEKRAQEAEDKLRLKAKKAQAQRKKWAMEAEKAEKLRLEAEMKTERGKAEKLLKERGFASVNAKRKSGVFSFKFPIHSAVKRNDAELVRALILTDAVLDSKDSQGCTALQLARKLDKNGSHTEVTLLLAEATAAPV